MGFAGIGVWEIGVVAVVALMLFSPRELPKMLRTVAKFWGQIKATADEFRDTIMHADGVDEIQELVQGTKGEIRKVESQARKEMMKARAEMRKARSKLMKANKAKEEIRKQQIAEEQASADPEEDGEGHGAFGGGEPPADSDPDRETVSTSHTADAPDAASPDAPVAAASPAALAKNKIVPPPIVSPPPKLGPPPKVDPLPKPRNPAHAPGRPASEPAAPPAASPADDSGKSDSGHNQGAA